MRKRILASVEEVLEAWYLKQRRGVFEATKPANHQWLGRICRRKADSAYPIRGFLAAASFEVRGGEESVGRLLKGHRKAIEIPLSFH